MEAKIRATGEIIEVEHEDLGGRASDVSFWCSSQGKSYSYMELDFKDSYKGINWEQRKWKIITILLKRGADIKIVTDSADYIINQLKQQSDEH